MTAPTTLTLTDLLARTAGYADDVRAGRYGPGEWPRTERWAERLHADDEHDVWLISWVPDRSTELHDHAGSLGALTVVAGALSEVSWNGSGLRRRRLGVGDGAEFPLGWVHDVTRHASAVDGAVAPSLPPTLSVHAYSPPLTAMSYYDVRDGRLRRVRSELTDRPEP
ncbi:cysteine dioxygenase [Tsukamurella sp. 8F]|uniref:cysteine dioxygenase n=1 Tax=unclassified Tsukamurella TaxID=2633480 RepID=UPI0023B98597|nr:MULTISPECIES: cysteine dioxygenase [unclassified Tsukamurella]MDF0531703.1 cysteine dioxygenase [Tsukamurella sp. 8J]MDF0588949.1 cysteine dioxygenase [Tsukamurella sp. 8F]